MKDRIKLTESQLKKVINKIIKEELMNELNHSTMQSALLKTKQDDYRQGQHKRMSKNYADRFFNKFIGKALYGGRITRIELDINDNDVGAFDKSFDIYVAYKDGEKNIFNYHHPSDSIRMGGKDSRYVLARRKDAILLCKIIGSYNPSTKYQINNINNLFIIKDNMQEAKIDRIIEQHIRKNLRNLK